MTTLSLINLLRLEANIPVESLANLGQLIMDDFVGVMRKPDATEQDFVAASVFAYNYEPDDDCQTNGVLCLLPLKQGEKWFGKTAFAFFNTCEVYSDKVTQFDRDSEPERKRLEDDRQLLNYSVSELESFGVCDGWLNSMLHFFSSGDPEYFWSAIDLLLADKFELKTY